MNPYDIKNRLAAARALPTGYAAAVALANLAERMHIEDREPSLAVLNEAIEHAQKIKGQVSRAYALRTMFNYVKRMGTAATRPILMQLASLQHKHDEPQIAETLIAALVSSRTDVEFVDELATRIQPDTRRAMAGHAIAVARQHHRSQLAPKQAGSKQEDYHCKTLGYACRIIYAAANRRGRRWQHDWKLQWCNAADRCGVRTDGITKWARCEHPDAHMRAVPDTKQHPTDSR